MRKKLVIIGAGSSMFTQGFAMDLIKNPGKYKWHLSLVDIDPKALESISKLIGKMFAAKNADVELSYSTDRCDVLPGADYVVATIGVGGRRAWEQDVFIPRKYGVFQPVGDTAMPGGISRSMRMIPAMLDITKDVMRLCPNAVFINYSNPMTNICRAVRKVTDFPMIGLCIGVEESVRYLAELAGVDRNKVTYLSAGLNHLTFIYDFRYEGQDVFPHVIEKYRELKSKSDFSQVGKQFLEMGEASIELKDPFGLSFLETHGAFPAPGDRHVTEFFTERFPGGKYYCGQLGIDAYSFENTIRFGDKIYAEADQEAHSEKPLPEGFFGRINGEHEQLMEIINSMDNDERKLFSTNLPNNGVIPNLPKDSIIEIPAFAGADGFNPMAQYHFPDKLAGMIMKFIAISEVTVEAALKGDRKLFAEAILMGGYLQDEAAVNRMVDELLKTQGQYLPQF